MAIDGADGRWVITDAEGSQSRVIVFHSTDKGQTWAQTSGDPPGQINPGADTDIVTTRTGRVITVEEDESTFKLATSFSDDGGKTWTASSGIPLADGDRPFLAVGPDDPTTCLPRVYLAWDNFTDFGGNIFVQTSVDDGATFGPPVPVTLPGDPAFADLQCGAGSAPSSIAVNSTTGQIYLAFGTRNPPMAGGCSPEFVVSVGPYATRIWVATSPDGSLRSWTQSLAVDDSTIGQVVGLVLSPAALDTAGNVYVAYAETKSSDDFTAAIRYVHAPADLGNWSAPVTVAPISGGAGHVLPHVVAGDPGKVDFAYMSEEIAPDGRHLWFSTMAQTLDGLRSSPHMTETRISDSPAVVGGVDQLESNCGSGPARGIENNGVCFLSRFADLYGVAIDGKGFLTVAWPAGPGTPDPGTFVATQVGGSSLH